MFDENQVVDALAAHLEQAGWALNAVRHGHQRGVDIEATREDEVLHVEAKGATSSVTGSKNHGRPFSGPEVRINLAEAFYTAAIAATAGNATVSAIAIPRTELYTKFLEPLRPAIARLSIVVFFVTDDFHVETLEPLRGRPAGPLWSAMNSRPRITLTVLQRSDLPHPDPGVYALYRDGTPVYVGLAERQSLRERFWGNHRGRGPSMTGSALRRNVAEHLKIASAADLKARRHIPSTSEVQRVNAWIDQCSMTWISCTTPAKAKQLEANMKTEFLPALTKR